MVAENISWWFCNVVLALFPLGIVLMLVRFNNDKKKMHELFKDGEFSFFSTTICASSIGLLVLHLLGLFANSQTSKAINTEVRVICALVTIFLLLSILMVSTGTFTFIAYHKLKGQDPPDKEVLFKYSVGCVVISVILGYLSFIQGGMK